MSSLCADVPFCTCLHFNKCSSLNCWPPRAFWCVSWEVWIHPLAYILSRSIWSWILHIPYGFKLIWCFFITRAQYVVFLRSVIFFITKSIQFDRLDVCHYIWIIYRGQGLFKKVIPFETWFLKNNFLFFHIL